MEGLNLTSKDTIDTSDRRFLAHFEPLQRSAVANLLLYAVRRGMTEPCQIVSAVRHDLLAEAIRRKRWGKLDAAQWREQIVTEIDASPDEAFDYAKWAVWWESLSYAEKQRIKAEKWMAQQPATDKQTKYLRALGYHGEIEAKLDASERIDRLLKGRV